MNPLINLTPIPEERVRLLDRCLDALGTIHCASLVPVANCPDLLVLKVWREDSGLTKHFVPSELIAELQDEDGLEPLRHLLAA